MRRFHQLANARSVSSTVSGHGCSAARANEPTPFAGAVVSGDEIQVGLYLPRAPARKLLQGMRCRRAGFCTGEALARAAFLCSVHSSLTVSGHCARASLANPTPTSRLAPHGWSLNSLGRYL
jgi:hypothetical protein